MWESSLPWYRTTIRFQHNNYALDMIDNLRSFLWRNKQALTWKKRWGLPNRDHKKLGDVFRKEWKHSKRDLWNLANRTGQQRRRTRGPPMCSVRPAFTARPWSILGYDRLDRLRITTKTLIQHSRSPGQESKSEITNTA
jgi:hypothetical protein